MSAITKITAYFDELVAPEFLNSAPARRILAGETTPQHYAGYLRQVFHQTRENPQLQALATVYLRGHQRQVIRSFYRHAISEIGHDQLAAEDLRTLGHDTSTLASENPLPETLGLLGFVFYHIEYLDPLAYLGYLFFLEYLPTQHGERFARAFSQAGVPPEAMSFLRDHIAIDVGHNKLMEGYIETLIRSEDERTLVCHAMRTTGRLYAHMMEAAFEQVDTPRDWGQSVVECRHLR